MHFENRRAEFSIHATRRCSNVLKHFFFLVMLKLREHCILTFSKNYGNVLKQEVGYYLKKCWTIKFKKKTSHKRRINNILVQLFGAHH